MNKSLLLFAAWLLLAGCQTTRYEMQPPPGNAGRACITNCSGIREVCRGNEINRARGERDACEHRAEHTLHACMASAESKEKRQECEKKKPSCWAYENYDRCEENYRGCYQQCGGTVIKIVE